MQKKLTKNKPKQQN